MGLHRHGRFQRGAHGRQSGETRVPGPDRLVRLPLEGRGATRDAPHPEHRHAARGRAHPENGRRFIDWVLSKELEERLAASRSAQIPVRGDVPRPEHVGRIGDFQAMAVDYVDLGRTIGERTETLKETFLR